ncbi:hypothetical protein [uncultured Pseudoflavonifractor sp.]|uniref:hypothetical protein n=1 Tax=uncultured Pseudoflavonifractor sp. TaxID=1221379 RepID=UPI0025E2A84F|nr:hypothetical protein [uncultured Pseudoflavonifractor sp.]
MEHYRSYMNRVKLSPEEHRALMDALAGKGRPARRPSPARWLTAAACLALVCAAAFGIWRLTGLPGGDTGPSQMLEEIPGGQNTAGPEATDPAPEDTEPIAADRDSEYVLSPVDPFDGQPHSSFNIQGVEYGDAPEICASIAYPDGWFEEQLTRAQMVELLGGPGAEDAPWSLYWVGYDITGKAVYDGEGNLWQLWLNGVSRSNSRNGFTLTVRPGDYPLTDMIDPDQTATEINGVMIYGSKGGRYGWDGSGEMGYIYEITMMSGNAGLSFEARQVEEENAEYLCTQAANTFAGTKLHLDSLLVYDGDVPDWGKKMLTWEEAMDDEKFGAYVPLYVPDGFTFEGAWREWGRDRDYLTLNWSGYYTSISIDILDAGTWGDFTLTDPADREKYDMSLYATPYSDSVPEEYRQEFDNPVFAIEDVTAQVIAARMRWVDGDSGDVDGWRGNFSVYYESENVLVRYDLDGVTPQEAYDLILKEYSTPPGQAATWEDILKGRGSFRDAASGQILELSTISWIFTPDESIQAQPTAFALLDLDGDGEEELVLKVWMGEAYDECTVVLFREGDGLYARGFGLRSMSDLRADGTFHYSSGAFDWGYARITSLTSTAYEKENVTYCLGERYVVDGTPADEAAFWSASEAQEAKAEPEWYPMDADGMAAAFG